MTDAVIYTQIPKASICVEKALEFGVADLHEAMGAVGERRMLMDPSMRALNVGLRIAGAAVTAFNYPGDNLLLPAAGGSSMSVAAQPEDRPRVRGLALHLQSKTRGRMQ